MKMINFSKITRIINILGINFEFKYYATIMHDIHYYL